MTIRASSATRLLVAVAVAWLGLALSAQAAHATYGKITIVKINNGGDLSHKFDFQSTLASTPAAGAFSLTGAQSAALAVAPLNQKTFQVECNVGSGCHSAKLSVTETIRPGYTLTGITCTHTQGDTYGWHKGFAGEPTTTSPLKTTGVTVIGGMVALDVQLYEHVKCWYTNTPNATIKVTKALLPATDSGRFNLLIDGQINKANIGDGGTTGVQTVTTGTHTVSETAGTASALANYDSTTSCVDTAHPAKPADIDGSLQVVPGDKWECTITNTRKTTPPVEPPTTPETPAPPVGDSPAPSTVPSPQIQVSPARVRPGSARLSGPSGCPTTSAVAATVSGRRIVKVTFYVDGKKVKTLTHANRKGSWVLPMNVRRFAFGTHRVRVTVQFATSSQTKAKTLRLSFSRCHPAVVRPNFTG